MSFENNVFINCPFDNTYINDLLKPMLYVIIKISRIPHLNYFMIMQTSMQIYSMKNSINSVLKN